MANRITEEEVGELVEVDENISATPFINAANQLVTELCTGSGYNDERLATIEAWLAAHFYLMREQVVASEKTGAAVSNYQYQIGLMLNQTKHGQMAMLLDTAGNLARHSKQMEEGQSPSVSIFWPGQDYDTEDDED